MFLINILTILLSLISCSSADKRYCLTKADCSEFELCDTEARQCVYCLTDDHCSKHEFCVRGRCRSKADQAFYCGASKGIAGSAGKACKNYSIEAAKHSDIHGPLCLWENRIADITQIDKAKCGCQYQTECGIDTSSMAVLCFDNACIKQSSKHCGKDGVTCMSLTGGNICKNMGNGFGECFCDSDEFCQSAVYGRRYADRCDRHNDKCSCGSLARTCILGSTAPDCCLGNCTNIMTDNNNCGECGRSCGSSLCRDGSCPCTSSNECKLTRTDSCMKIGAESFCVCSAFKENATGMHKACGLGLYCCEQGCCDKPCSSESNNCSRNF